MKTALVCPDDLSVVLFCKGIVNVLQKDVTSEIYIISDVFGNEGYYTNIIRSWKVKHIALTMSRYINPFKDLKYMYSLYRIFRQRRIDAVINISTKPNIYGTIAAKFANANKILCSVWGRGSVFVEKADLSSNLLKLSVLGLYWLAFRLSSKVWFTNMNDYNYFVSHHIVLPQKTILTKNYVNTEDYQPYSLSTERELDLRRKLGLSDVDRVVVMVGRGIWAKGVREFIEASRILKNKLPFVKFIFIGPKEDCGPDAVPESYLRESEKSGNFLWVGFRKDVKDLYALSDLAVLPSYYREGGYPRALTEPMAMGKPVITTDSIDCRSPVENGQNGYLVPIKNAEALANAIEILMKDDEKRERFGQYSRLKAVKEYDEKIIVQQVIKEFLQV